MRNGRSVRERILLTNAALAFAGDAAVKAASLVGVAIAARLLPTGEFARLGVALAASSLLASALDAGFATLIVRDGAPSAARRSALVRASLRARAPLVLLVVLGGATLGSALGELRLALLTVATAVLGALSVSVLALFRAAQNLRPEALQKTALAIGGVVFLTGACLVQPSATVALGALLLAPALSLPLLARRARTVTEREARVPAFTSLRSALPFACLGLATLVYYRSGTLILGAVSSASATAAYTVASTIAFGLLIVPNAVTTGLLPRLSVERTSAAILAPARLGLALSAGSSVVAGALVVGSAPWTLPLVFGDRADGVLTPLAILAVATVAIAASGTLGTVLVAARRIRMLGVQVGASLVVNLTAGFVLAPRFGAVGAATATLATEVVAVSILALAVAAARPGILPSARFGLRPVLATRRGGSS